jgi:hypothetical protein
MVIAIAALQILLVFLQKAISITANNAARQTDMIMFIMAIFLPFFVHSCSYRNPIISPITLENKVRRH